MYAGMRSWNAGMNDGPVMPAGTGAAEREGAGAGAVTAGSAGRSAGVTAAVTAGAAAATGPDAVLASVRRPPPRAQLPAVVGRRLGAPLSVGVTGAAAAGGGDAADAGGLACRVATAAGGTDGGGADTGGCPVSPASEGNSRWKPADCRTGLQGGAAAEPAVTPLQVRGPAAGAGGAAAGAGADAAEVGGGAAGFPPPPPPSPAVFAESFEPHPCPPSGTRNTFGSFPLFSDFKLEYRTMADGSID